jgi:hypothetical protein
MIMIIRYHSLSDLVVLWFISDNFHFPCCDRFVCVAVILQHLTNFVSS